MPNPILTAERLRSIIHYDPDTGLFTWKINRNQNAKVGSPCGHIGWKGYVIIGIDDGIFQGGRVAWLYMTGAWPTHQVDHKDTVRSNNKWSNLRELDNRHNAQNKRKATSSSKSGLLGVSSDATGFRASLRVDGVRHRSRLLKTAEEAHALYLEWKKLYHPASTL